VDSYLSYGSGAAPERIVEGIHQLASHTLTLEDWQVTTEPLGAYAHAADGR
jgi:hypothetical protein